MDKANNKQRVVCAALKYSDGLIVAGPRHFDGIMYNQLGAIGCVSDEHPEQGFLDQRGKFLTREEAYLIATENNQIIRRVGGDEGKLFSENLY